MSFRKHAVMLFAVLSPLVIAGCGGPESDFLAALNVKEQTPVCVSQGALGVELWTRNDDHTFLSEDSSLLASDDGVKALAPLQAKGYVAKEPTELRRGFGSSITAFALTDKGSKHFKADGNVCVGEKHATGVVEYTEPAKGSPMQVAMVKFTYDITFNDFVADLGIGDVLRESLKKGVGFQKLDGKGEADFVKTNKGWSLQGAIW